MSTPAATAAAAAAAKMLVFKSADGESFEVEEAVALKWQTIKHFVEEEDCADSVIPITGEILAKVIEYSKKHEEADDQSLESFDAEFIRVDQGTQWDLIQAAKCLGIKSLEDLAWGKISEEFRRDFVYKSDFVLEEGEEEERDWKTLVG